MSTTVLVTGGIASMHSEPQKMMQPSSHWLQANKLKITREFIEHFTIHNIEKKDMANLFLVFFFQYNIEARTRANTRDVQ